MRKTALLLIFVCVFFALLLSSCFEETPNVCSHIPAAEVQENRQEASCSAEGHYEAVVYCTVCEEEISRETVVLPTLLHETEGGVCATCGRPESSPGLIFTLNEDGCSYTLTGVEKGHGSDLTVDLYNGLPVTAIGEKAFGQENTVLTTITLGPSVAKIGYAAFQGCSKIEELHMPSSVQSIGMRAFDGCTSLRYVTLSENTVSIGSEAFSGCRNLQEITLPGSVTYVGTDAFYGCNNLGEVYITDLLKWCAIEFENALSNPISVAKNAVCLGYEAVTELHIPDGVKRIGKYAFYGFPDLVSVTFSPDTEEIGEGAFYNCQSLREVTLPESLTLIGALAFRECAALTEIEIPNSVQEIGGDAFSLSGLTEIHLGSGLKRLGAGAFKPSSVKVYITDLGALLAVDFETLAVNPLRYKENLYCNGEPIGELYIPEGTVCIGHQALTECADLRELIIPDSVTEIGSLAFSKCPNLTSVHFGTGVTRIGESAFKECTELQTLTVSEKNGSYAVEGGCLIEKASGTLLLGTNNSTVPSSSAVTKIAPYAFAYYEGLETVTIPENIKEIGTCAFFECRFLATLTVGSGVTEWGDRAFSGCTKLTYLTLEYGMTVIGSNAFEECRGLKKVIIPDTVTELRERAFIGCLALEELVIGSGICEIPWNAFNSSVLKSVTFRETEGWLDKRGNPIDPVTLADKEEAARLLMDDNVTKRA